MKFTTRKTAYGTGFRGCFNISYVELVEIFGPPQVGPNADLDKTTCEWCLEFEDGTVATIYDWLNTRTPRGVSEWHIGGYEPHAAERVYSAIELHRDPLYRMIKDYETP